MSESNKIVSVVTKCTLCGWDKDELIPFKGRMLCEQCYQGEINEPDLQLPGREEY